MLSYPFPTGHASDDCIAQLGVVLGEEVDERFGLAKAKGPKLAKVRAVSIEYVRFCSPKNVDIRGLKLGAQLVYIIIYSGDSMGT